MENLISRIASADWEHIALDMHQKGYAIIPKLLNPEQCETLKQDYQNPAAYRKLVIMERHRFGLGEYKYFNYPLPDLIQIIRESVFPKLASIANTWMKMLNLDQQFPDTLAELLKQCRDKDQTKLTVLILKYGAGGYNTLHRIYTARFIFLCKWFCF